MKKARPHRPFMILLLAAGLAAAPANSQTIGWHQILGGTGDVWSIAIGPGGLILVATASGLYGSTNAGASWTLVGFSPSTFGSSPSAVAINPANSHAFVGLSAGGGPPGVPGPFGGGGSGVYRSTNGGVTWTPWNVGNPGVFAVAVTAGGAVIAGTSGPTGGNGGLFISSDDGVSWTYRDCCFPHSLAITSSGGIFAGDTYVTGGVFRSTDSGASWAQVGLANSRVDSIAVGFSDHLFAGTASSGIFRSTDGLTWTLVNGGFSNPVTSLVADSVGSVFAGVFGNGVFSSIDEGGTWKQDNSGLTDLRVEALAISFGNYILAGTPSGVFQLTGYGICALYDQTKSVKSGAVFPIKLQLCDANGNDVSSSAVVVHATRVTFVSGLSGDVVDAGNANPDSDFRFDATLGPTGGYIFNLSTTGLASGSYTLQFTAGNDPFIHSVNFGVK